MGSIHRDVREKQKAEAEAAVEARIAKLKAEGVDEKKMARDVYLRRAKAVVRKALHRISAIDAREAIALAAAQRKAEAAANPKVKVKKSAQPADGKAKAKAKDKDKDKDKKAK